MDLPRQPDAMAGDEAHSFSTHQERASDASEIELMPLVPSTASTIQHDGVPDRTADLRNDTDTATSPDEIDGPAPKDRSSLHSPEPGPRTKDSSFLKKLAFDSWIGEAIAIALSIGCLIAIAVIVHHYDGEPLPQWRGGVTLNTVISVLSTTARSGMIFVVSGTMGQLKWCWLGQSRRRLLDMQVMDDASRGPMGAARILASLGLTGGTLATFSAVTTVLMVAFSPFLQQLLTYPLHDVEQEHMFALAPRNLNYTSLLWSGNMSLDLISAMEAGMWSTPRLLEPTCPTARCEWDNFKSIGWCSKCADLTASAILDCNIVQYFQNTSSYLNRPWCELSFGTNHNISLVSEPFNRSQSQDNQTYTDQMYTLVMPVDVDSINMVYSDPYEHKSSEPNFIGESRPLLVLAHVQLSLAPSLKDRHWRTKKPVDIVHVEKVSQCILSLCEREVTIKTEEGSVHSTLSSTNYGNLFEYGGAVCWQPEEENVTMIDEGETVIDEGEEREITSWIDRNTSSFCSVDMYPDKMWDYFVTSATLEVFEEIVTSDSPKYRPLWTDQSARTLPDINIIGDKSTRSLEERLQNVAISLTNYGLETTNETARGRAYAEESYVEVRWWWILLPTLLQLSTLILFITTVVYSHHNSIPIWKSSILAIIYHGVEGLDGKKYQAAERLSGMNTIARVDKMRFSRSADGIHHLYGRSHG
jgi:hypothetical protein